MTRINTEVTLDNNSNRVIKGIKKPAKGFWEFLNRYSVISLAIGIIIGQTTKDAVNILVSGIITPAIQLLMPKTEIQDLVVNVRGAEFMVGAFLNSLLEMIIIMGIIYLVFGIIFKNSKVVKKKKK
jgi:large conductance mechanosensitive channel protein